VAPKAGAKSERVAELNAILAELSYLPKGFRSATYGAATAFAVTAFQMQAGLNPDGVAGPKTLRALARAKSAPRPRLARSGKWIRVSLARQLAYLVRDGAVVRTIHVPSATSGFTTPRGEFEIYRKQKISWSVRYKVWLPWASYFTGGIAFHAYPDVPAYPASHGCVRVPPPFAQELYRFASYATPVIVS
jgi:lipoprotein-anchoring transpeptidase ErfK/SrfK